MTLKKTAAALLGGVGLAALATGAAAQTTIQMNTYNSDPEPRKMIKNLVKRFEKAHPDYNVELNITDHEAYKTQIRNFLVADPPDVVTWFAGNRMNQFVKKDLFMPVSDVWDDQNLHNKMSQLRSIMSREGEQYGVPYAYYQWGMFYRADILEKHGIEPPKTWDQLMAAAKKLKANGVTPFAMGNKNQWTAAAWFDYLNIRINGPEYHLDLMNGRDGASYADKEVKKVFDTWRKLVENDYYIKNFNALDWQEGIQPMWEGEAAMTLMGNFLVWQIPDDVKQHVEFVRFPGMPEMDVKRGEEAPTDAFFIPAGADHPKAAKEFLRFAATAEQQSKISHRLNLLPPHKDADLPDNRFIKAGAETLRKAEVITQFYDRDHPSEMASAGLSAFQEFLDRPQRQDQILDRLQSEYKRVMSGN